MQEKREKRMVPLSAESWAVRSSEGASGRAAVEKTCEYKLKRKKQPVQTDAGEGKLTLTLAVGLGEILVLPQKLLE
jgi:hypothetical protein